MTTKWLKLNSIAAINRYQSQFSPDAQFTCRTDYGTMPNGALGRIDTYTLDGAEKMRVMTANDHSYSKVFGV